MDGRGVGKRWLVGFGRGLSGGLVGGVIGEVGSRVAAKVITRLFSKRWELRILRGVARWGLVGWIGFAKLKFIFSCERNMRENSLLIFKQNQGGY